MRAVLLLLLCSTPCLALSPHNWVRPNHRGILTYQPKPMYPTPIHVGSPDRGFALHESPLPLVQDPATGEHVYATMEVLIRTVNGVKITEMIRNHISNVERPVPVYHSERLPPSEQTLHP